MDMYEKAKARVENSAILSLYSETILYEWDEGDEHWEWVISADEDEILEWAQSVGGLD